MSRIELNAENANKMILGIKMNDIEVNQNIKPVCFLIYLKQGFHGGQLEIFLFGIIFDKIYQSDF